MESTKPILSICIPTYNRAELLDRMLCSMDCALARTSGFDYEVVFHDNASTDATRQVIEAFAENHPVTYRRNEENIGAERNILGCAEGASGEYIWMLGDDDLVMPDAFVAIQRHLSLHPDLDGHIACHAIAHDQERVLHESLLDKGIIPETHSRLIEVDPKLDRLDSLERVYEHTSVSAALNFLSNVISRRELWCRHVQAYQKHCEGREWFSDTITSVGHMLVWADFLVGKPVGLIARPLVIGYVGQQPFLGKWPTLCTVFLLDVSRHFLANGADPACMLIYQRKIYLDHHTIRTLILSKDPYARKHFSLRRLLGEYGGDPQLWNMMVDAVSGTGGRLETIRLCMHTTAAVLARPKRWCMSVRLFFPSAAKRLLKREMKKLGRGVPHEDYASHVRQLNQLALAYFSRSTGAHHISRIEHPIQLKGPQYMAIGESFSSGPGLRLECWDDYRGYRHTPKLEIGDRVCFNNNCHVGVINSVRIGNDVLIGSNVLITDHQHGELSNLVPGKTHAEQPLHSKGPVVIEDNVWVGENACIMPGVTVGTGAVIGANAVVTKDVPPRSVVGGIPARTIRTLAAY